LRLNHDIYLFDLSLKKIVDAKVAGWEHEIREALKAGIFVDVVNTDAILIESELPRIVRQYGAHLELDHALKMGLIRFPR